MLHIKESINYLNYYECCIKVNEMKSEIQNQIKKTKSFTQGNKKSVYINDAVKV